ncbi:MAG: hypothetical protein IJ736_05195 [Firmicutes bacterium]|nr:hypothetical protein [Bacillota bacterium]
MKRFRSLFEFYRSDEWANFRERVIMERMDKDGNTIDEVTGKVIVKAYDTILHHIEPLTEENVNDYFVSLNPENIQIVSHRTHNIIHDKIGNHRQKQVFLVYGAPLSGKTSWVKENACKGDLILDIDNIWQSVSGLPRYEKPGRLKAIVFRIYDEVYDAIRYRDGKWFNAFVVGGFPLKSERERTVRELQAREVYIECEKEICLERLAEDKERNEDWKKYIGDWFEKFGRG